MKKALVVDDEHTVCDVLSEFLSELGYSVITAYDGPEALEEFERHNPDLVLLDIRLPTLGGLELLRRFKRSSPGVVIIMITAFPDEFMSQRTIQAGASDFIPKPIDLDCLEKSISSQFPTN